jgi:hypothetical protein
MKYIVILFALIQSYLSASQLNVPVLQDFQPSYNLWYTGSLLQLTPVNLSPGQIAIQPVVIVSSTYGFYNSNWEVDSTRSILSINPIMEFKMGLFPKTEIKVVGAYISKFQRKESSSNFQDMFLYFGYEILKDKKHSIIPDLSLFLQVTVPTGRFDNLDSQKVILETSGQGAYQIGPALSYQKAFYLPKNHFILYGNIIYLFSTQVSLKGYNAYGGGKGANGKISPGDRCFFILSGEYLFNQNWGLVCDAQLLYQGKTNKFKGNPGITESGTSSAVGLPASFQISITPSIEYNFSANCGVYGGAWLTIAGKNAAAFAGSFAALVYGF